MHPFIEKLGLTVPLVQAPMAGVATPQMAVAVSEAGALGSLGLGSTTPDMAHAAINAVKQRTHRPFNVNFFCHRPPQRDATKEAAWIDRARPFFDEFGAAAPEKLEAINKPFQNNPAMLDVLLELKPPVVSFHFGLPPADQIARLRETGARLMASATSLAEARTIEAAGLDAVVAQGWSAGGHRGIFDPESEDERLSTDQLAQILVRETSLPVIAAGGLMDGADIRRLLNIGAAAAQLGTAFVACAEGVADDAYRERLIQGGRTIMTSAISGRPARCLTNRFTAFTETTEPEAVPAYPCAYDLGKALNAAAKAKGEIGFGAHWSGQGVARIRPMAAGELVGVLSEEIGRR